ncbi:MAG: hypothetical protein RMJ98_02365 [Myxococcales bacterium]|nr:hypothetical protein [Polyangiaceae bacterium]MDW8248133.1 hypothetical protein [Myxococcales bacterium]
MLPWWVKLSTLDTALIMVRRAPDYFHDDPRPWLSRALLTERTTFWTLDDILLRRWMRKTLAEAPAEPIRWVMYCLARVAHAIVNQRQAAFELREGIHERFFWYTGLARLIRGYTNCEGQNFLLARLLAWRLRGVELFEIQGEQGSLHTVVRLPLGGGVAFADAWGEVPLYRLDALDSLPSLAALRASGLTERHGVYPRPNYERGVRTSLNFVSALTRQQLVDRAAPAPREAIDPHSLWWEQWLEARVHHLFGHPEDALSRYETLLSSAPRAWLSQVVKAHQHSLRAP